MLLCQYSFNNEQKQLRCARYSNVLRLQKTASGSILIAMLTKLIVSVLAGSVFAQKCSDVYPHLSCGLRANDQESCEEVGCCWSADEAEETRCFAPAIFGYNFESTSEEPGKQIGILKLNQPSGIAFGKDYTELAIDVTQETAERTHIKISVPGVDTWEVPETLIPRPGGLYTGRDAKSKTIIMAQNDDDPYDNMEILISRAKLGVPTGELLFIFTKMLVFQEQYIQFVLGSPPDTAATFGFGESSRLSQRLQANTTYTLWNTDMPASNFEHSLYGSHPFYIQVSKSGKAHGVFFMNSNAMDVTLTESADQGNTIGIQSTGGLVDLYIFAGPTPSDVVRQYLEVVGRPALVPYWSLGFHNCRWGYPNVAYIDEVVKNYSLANIPLETQWVDIDYMVSTHICFCSCSAVIFTHSKDEYKDFTLDPVRYSEKRVKDLIHELHKNNQRFVPILDPAISSTDPSYSSYQKGMELDVFVKDLYGKQPYLGQVRRIIFASSILFHFIELM